ncbi:MAG: hypothetical protein EBR81_14935, partial [Proteobacteria bacterium]|nr:hypothetical protein [Pseudomonadota bacterium]
MSSNCISTYVLLELFTLSFSPPRLIMILRPLSSLFVASIAGLLLTPALRADLMWINVPKGLDCNSGTYAKTFEVKGPILSAWLRVATN